MAQRGRPPGSSSVVQRRSQAAQELARSWLADGKVRQRYITQLRDGTLPLELEKLIWHYAYGVPRLPVALSTGNEEDNEAFEVVVKWQPLPHHEKPDA